MDENLYNYLLSRFAKVLIIAGENGSGKSRYLRKIAKIFRGTRSVTVVCNTVFDRFTELDNVAKISVADGKNVAAEAIKRVLQFAFSESDPLSYKPIGQVLNYCGYSGLLGVEIDVMAPNLADKFASNTDVRRPPRDEFNELEEAFHVLSDIPGRITWINLAETDFSKGYIRRAISVLLKHEKLLKNINALRSVNLYLSKNNTSIPLDEGSSGELTLIASRVFLASTIQEDEIILIDEPENSLHPLWQREYIHQLLDILYLKQPTIVIATHSPIIVSTGQLKEEDGVAEVDIGIYKIEDVNPNGWDYRNDENEFDNGKRLVKVEDNHSNTSSVEDIYWKVFDTVTPVNHFVSETLVSELNKLANGKTTLGQTEELISQMDRGSYDPAQKEFFSGVKSLAQRIIINEDNETNGGDSLDRSPD